MKNRTTFAFLAFALLAVALPASAAQTAGEAAKGVFNQFKDFADLATAGAFLAGIVVGITSLFKFKAYSENPQQNKISTPLILALVAAGLIGLPAYLNMSKETVLTDEGGSMESGDYTKIGG